MNLWDRISAALDIARQKTFGAAFEAIADMKAKRDEATFSIALIALSAKIAKADGVATEAEFAAFRKFFEFPESEAVKVRMIYDLAKKDVAGFTHYVTQTARIFEDERNVLEDVLDCLLHVALADGMAHPQELSLLDATAETFELSPAAWRRLKAAHLGGNDEDPYFLLGLDHGASEAEIRTRYRELMREHHPDVLMARGVPANLVKIAESRTATINAAYEKILAERAN